MKRLIIGISGASGAIYGVRLLQVLREVSDVETHLILSQAARQTLALETDYAFAAVAGSVDLRELDAVRRSYVRSLQEMCCVLDQLKASPALTGAAE